MPSSNTRVCPVCATVMPAGFPAGLCPKCLLTASVEPAPAADEARPDGVPSVEVLRRLFPELDILELLGAGGMGAVYKARQPRLNRLVALKIMVCPPGHEADFALRFEREAQVLARLNHPHIVILYDFGELSPERTGADPLFYFLMEHVDGTDLGQLIKARELTSSQALAIVPQICEALQYAHDQGVTHRDIKPANILLDKKGVVKIADFGLAKMIGTGTEETLMGGLTQTGTAMGTPHYMAPEQWEHPQQVDHRVDIYALGVVFYEMLTGERPAGVFEPPSRKTSPPVDKKLDGVVLRAMDKNPERRYQQAGQIRDDVTRISGANKRRPASANDASEAKRGSLKALLAMGSLTVLAAGGWGLWQMSPESVAILSSPPRPNTAQAPEESATRSWRSAFPDLSKVPGLVEKREGWVLSSQLTVPVRTPSGGEMELLNAGIRARMRFSEDAGSDAAQLILRRGSRGGDHFELRYYRNSSGDQPNQFQIRQWDHKLKRSSLLAGMNVGDDVHASPEGFGMEFYAIGSRLYGRLNGAHALSVEVPDASFVNPGEVGFALLKACWLKDMEVLDLDGVEEAEALKLAGLGGDEARESGRGDDPAGAPWENLLDDPELKSSLRPAAAGYEARHWATVERGPGRDGAIRCRLLYDGKPNYFRLVALKQDKGWYQAYLMPWGGMIQYVDSELPVGKFKDLPEVETSRLPAALEPGQEVELELRVRGESLEFRVNGQVVCTGSDMHLGPGRWGFCNNSETPVTIRSLDFQNASSLEPGAGGLPATGLTLRALIHGGSRYTLIREKLPWPDARRRAEALGRSLAVFESEEEERAVRDHFRDSLGTGCWIGGHAEEGSPDIRWLSGTPVGTVTWAVGHPYWRADKNSAGAQTEGTFWPAGLVLTGQSVLIQPQKGARIGFICEQPADAAGRSRDTPGLPGRLRAAGTTANGKPHDLAKFAAHDDFVDVAGGWGRWVALRANGQTVSSDGRADFTGITKIAASFNAEYAFITQAGKLVIPDDETWALPAELEQGVVDAALGMQHGIALLEGGRAVVFGARYEGVVGDPVNPRHYGTPRWPPPEARALEQVKAVAATVTHAATLHEDGSLSLWGWEGPLEWRADPRQKPLRQLRSTEDGFWALDEAGQLWHQPVPRNPAPGQPVHVPGKPSLVESGVTHLRAPCWRRRSGEWSAHISTKEGMALMKDAGITEHTAFSLNGGLFAGKPFASLLWIEPEATDSGR